RSSASRASGIGLATNAIRLKLWVAGLIAGLVVGRSAPRTSRRTRPQAAPATGKVGNMERAVFVYTTYPSIVEAERAGRALVEQRLCACVNILPGMISHYWWQGAVARREGRVRACKIRGALARRLGRAEKETDSYTRPATLVLPIERVDRGYLDWLMAEPEPATKG